MISNLWNLIVESNTLNFLILAVILLVVFKKINIGETFLGLQRNIENEVNEATLAKTNSEKTLSDAQKKMENVEQEIENIIENTKSFAENLSEKIINQADEQIKIIQKNSDNAMNNDFQKTKKSLSDMAAGTSVKLLKNNLKDNLSADKNLHNIFIEEAISELEGLEI